MGCSLHMPRWSAIGGAGAVGVAVGSGHGPMVIEGPPREARSMLTTTRPGSLVCGVDSSAHAPDVAAVAARLADRLGLRLRLVHSADSNVYVDGERGRDALMRGRQLLDGLGAHDSAADRVVDLGHPAELLRAAIDETTALAVVGSRGRGPGRVALLGS